MTAQARAIVEGLSLEALCGQVLMGGLGPVAQAAELRLPRNPRPGAFILFRYNIPSPPEALAVLSGAIQDRATALDYALPPILAIDHEGGDVFRFGQGLTRLPPARDVSGPESAYAWGYIAATELRSLGITMALAPVLECLTAENSDFLYSRSYGADPIMVGLTGAAFIRGLQSYGVMAVAKHFPGTGGVDPHRGLSSLPRGAIDRLAPSFREAVDLPETGLPVAGVMLSHVLVPELDETEPSSRSAACLSYLRGTMGFQGLAITDDLAMRASTEGMGPAASCLASIKAGADMVMISSDYGLREAYETLLKAARDGSLPMDRLREAVMRIVFAKLRYRLMDERDSALRERRATGFAGIVAQNGRLGERLQGGR